MSKDQMSFWEHLDALRSTLIRMALTLVVAAIALFVAMPKIFDTIVLWPCDASFPLYKLFEEGYAGDLLPSGPGGEFHINLININLASQLMIQLSTSFQMALVLTFPLLIYELWCFIRPGLYKHERRKSKKAFFFANIMFYLGVFVGYIMVFPIALRFLADYSLSDQIVNTLSLDSYIDNFTAITLLMGVVFEVPLLAWILGLLGLLTRGFFSKYRRHAIVALLIAAAFITPTGDPFSLFAVFIPLYFLWEMAAYLVPKEKPEIEEEEDQAPGEDNTPKEDTAQAPA